MKQSMVCMAIAAALCAGCGSKSEERDTATDPDAIPDTVEEDAAGEDGPAAECTGTGSVSFDFIEDDAPVAGVAVVLRCGDDVREAASGTDGRVTFEGLNVSERPVDVTWVHEGEATTWLGYGGARGAPDVMEIDLTEEEYQAGWVPITGDVTYSETGSIVIVSGPQGTTLARGGDPYEIHAPDGGTDLPIAFLEYTTSGGDATPIGFASTTFDAPAGGGAGPVADADPAAVFDAIGVTLAYDLAAESPVAGRSVAEDGPILYTRPYFGLHLYDAYPDAGGEGVDFSIQVGITTAWTRGTSTDQLTLSYVPAAITGEPMPGVVVTDSSGLWFTSTYPAWPIADGATIDVRDVPPLGGPADVATPVTPSDVLAVTYAPWAAIEAVSLYRSEGFGAFNSKALWSVLVPPEGASFSFGDLPLPSGVSMEDIVPTGPTAPRTMLSVGGIEADADPFDGYQGWIVEGWWDDRFVGRAVDGRYRFELP